MGPQPWSNVAVEDPKAADYSAIVIGKQRESDAVLVRKAFENFLRIITDRRDADPIPFQQQTGLFQLDQLGPAVPSPIRAAMKHQQQAVGPGKILERSPNAALIWKGEIGKSLAWLRTGGVNVVGGVDVLSQQLLGDRLTGGPPPSKVSHDRSLFSLVRRYFVRHRMSLVYYQSVWTLTPVGV
jgi:hypothetical protein